jgi:hypothetical protein
MRLQEIEENQQYANLKQLRELAAYMQKQIPGSSFKVNGAGKGKPVPHIRVSNVTKSELNAMANSIGLNSQPIDDKQSDLSSQFKSGIFGFYDRLGTLYSFVISTKGSSKDRVGIAKKALTPTGLGLDGKKLKRKELVAQVRAALPEKVRDKRLVSILDQLVTIAEQGKGQLSADDMKYIADSRAVISSDFGEILAPIRVMGDRDIADFPVGNNPIVDVYVIDNRGNQIGYAVKSLSGSGNSFAAISDLMDSYEAKLKEGSKERALYEIIKMFKKGQPGSVKDQIVAASVKANTKEVQAMVNAIGKFQDFNSLKTQLANKLKTAGGTADYTAFLKLVYPVSMAGGWGKAYGMPADTAYYLSGGKGNKPADTQAGKKSYDRDPDEGGANIATYVLGQSLLQMATKGVNADLYNKMMTDIVSTANVQLGKIDISNEGTLVVRSAPFSGIKFRFDYHASSNTPGQNRPGFIMAKE